MERLFVAVWPPADVVDALLDVELGDGVRRVRSERLHVTLCFLGAADADEVVAALDNVTLPAATAVLGGTLGLLGRDAVVVPVEGLDALAAVVGGATGRLGTPLRERFVGHLTVGRARHGRGPGRRHAGTTPIAPGSDSIGMPDRAGRPAQFAVREVRLVRSVPGAPYATLRTWATAPTVAT